MRILDELRLWLRSLFRRSDVDRELNDELSFHLDKLIEQKLAAGMPFAEARAAAQHELGGIAQLSEECRDARRVALVDQLFQDVRYGLRMLRRSPGFSVVAILSLGLGIGANTAIFTLIDALILKKLPVSNPEELATIHYVTPQGPQGFMSYQAFEFLRRNTRSFQAVFVQRDTRFNIGEGGEERPVDGAFVSGDYFSSLGLQPLAGRLIEPAEEAPVAVISHRYWLGRFGGDKSIIGRTIVLQLTPATVVGVLPAGFSGVIVGQAPDVFVPLSVEPALQKDRSLLRNKKAWWLQPLARKKPGVSNMQAGAELDVLWPRMLSEVLPQKNGSVRQEFRQWKLGIVDAANGLSGIRRDFSQPLYVLMGIVSLVLLIACANIANLLLARTSARQREIAVRLALGSGRFRLIRQLLTESVMLSSFGAIPGIFFAYGSCRLVVSLFSSHTFLDVSPDARIFGFTAGVAILTGLLFGAGPALRAASLNINARSSTERTLAGKALVVSQVALSLLLLVGAGLFARTFANLMRQDTGFDRHHVFVAHIDPRDAGIKGAGLQRLYMQLYDRLNGEPGVRSASISMMTPIAYCCWWDHIDAEGSLPGSDQTQIFLNTVSPGYFATFGTPIVAGRDFTPRDGQGGPLVAVVNEALAKHFFPGSNPIGKHIDAGEKLHNAEIVGVVKSTNQRSLRAGIEASAYFPLFGDPKPGDMSVAVRTDRGLDAAASLLRRDVQRFHPDIAVNVESYENQIGETAAQDRLTALLASFFGLLAASLACIGLYGLMSYTVVRRTSELGIRTALGAQKGDLLWMILRETLLLSGIGVALGVPAAVLCARSLSSLSSLLYGLRADDAATIAMTAGVLILVTALAGYLPARRAAQIDAMAALRNE